MLPQNTPAMASLVLKQETLKDRVKVLECLAVNSDRPACRPGVTCLSFPSLS